MWFVCFTSELVHHMCISSLYVTYRMMIVAGNSYLSKYTGLKLLAEVC